MKTFKALLVSIIVVLAAACNFTEEIHFKDDGSGKLSIQFDGSEIMEIAGEEMTKSGEVAVDSIISFKDILEENKDSINQLPADVKDMLKKLESFSMRSVLDLKKKLLMFDLFSEFKNVSEMNDAFVSFQDACSLVPSVNAQQGNMQSTIQATSVNYSFKKDIFARSSKIIDQVLFQQQIDSLQETEMYLSGTTYTLKYHFPKKIKSTTAKEATISQDGKTLIYKVHFIHMLKDPSVLDFEVKL